MSDREWLETKRRTMEKLLIAKNTVDSNQESIKPLGLVYFSTAHMTTPQTEMLLEKFAKP